MVMHKVDREHEEVPPPKRIIDEMGALVGEMMAKGQMVDGAGLHPATHRAQVTMRGGARDIERGPYTGSNELLASFAMIEADSLDHAVEQAAQAAAAAAIGDVELEVGKVVEPWDLGVAPEPEGMTPRFLVLVKADRAFEQGEPTTRHQAFAAALAKGGSVLSAATLAPSRQGARSTKTAGKRTWTDGPFTESKELVGGYCILELPSLADAQQFADRYAAILGDNEIDVRVVRT
jgi:hypothetical protein